ncbi:hypothetical protein CONCODRAFT_13267 [Conidiobolus coronatus NRRL 28638]|uniref:Uncharacterized protein n=1 Tax=Conidiobolus coronatus (strain ATCC 28846 / CBS 209.66 / NRRL 28638) TaxID=796925 RepID=A0A137NR79_CONC2|nr:hypothetical protein CONCODRAFT_13267 [Conidiobolus coronatus NRRL 28638]|eukprot:KXN65224.1 hypothetical protein CONCODRAFT_13267 [Conidiobolus coronatus NRRL 28638]
MKLSLLALLGAASIYAQDGDGGELPPPEECPDFWDIGLFSARGFIGKTKKYLECNNINKKGCRYFIDFPPPREKTNSGCVQKQEPNIPDVMYFDYTCKDKKQVKRFEQDMIKNYNLTCYAIKKDIFGP